GDQLAGIQLGTTRRTLLAIQSPTSRVPREPPISAVVCPSATAAATAFSMDLDSWVAPLVSRRSAMDRQAPIGLATFFPASGGADPWTGSHIEVPPGWMLPAPGLP